MSDIQSAREKSGVTVVGRDGLRGVLDPSNDESKWAGMTLDSGERVWIDRHCTHRGSQR